MLRPCYHYRIVKPFFRFLKFPLNQWRNLQAFTTIENYWSEIAIQEFVTDSRPWTWKMTLTQKGMNWTRPRMLFSGICCQDNICSLTFVNYVMDVLYTVFVGSTEKDCYLQGKILKCPLCFWKRFLITRAEWQRELLCWNMPLPL